MPYPNFHAARMRDPDKYDRVTYEKHEEVGVDVLLGWKGDKSEVQAYRFDKDKFTEAEARKWLKDHDLEPILFEPATDPMKKAVAKWNDEKPWVNDRTIDGVLSAEIIDRQGDKVPTDLMEKVMPIIMRRGRLLLAHTNYVIGEPLGWVRQGNMIMVKVGFYNDYRTDDMLWDNVKEWGSRAGFSPGGNFIGRHLVCDQARCWNEPRDLEGYEISYVPPLDGMEPAGPASYVTSVNAFAKSHKEEKLLADRTRRLRNDSADWFAKAIDYLESNHTVEELIKHCPRCNSTYEFMVAEGVEPQKAISFISRLMINKPIQKEGSKMPDQQTPPSKIEETVAKLTEKTTQLEGKLTEFSKQIETLTKPIPPPAAPAPPSPPAPVAPPAAPEFTKADFEKLVDEKIDNLKKSLNPSQTPPAPASAPAAPPAPAPAAPAPAAPRMGASDATLPATNPPDEIEQALTVARKDVKRR